MSYCQRPTGFFRGKGKLSIKTVARSGGYKQECQIYNPVNLRNSLSFCTVKKNLINLPYQFANRRGCISFSEQANVTWVSERFLGSFYEIVEKFFLQIRRLSFDAQQFTKISVNREFFCINYARIDLSSGFCSGVAIIQTITKKKHNGSK